MMDQREKDEGTIAALMLRMQESRLPRAEHLLEKVDQGGVLDDADIQFLKRVNEDYRSNQGLIKRNPDYFRIMSAFIDLYAEIVAKGLANEKAR